MENARLRAADATEPTVPFQRSRVYELLAHALGEPSGAFLKFAKGGGLLSSIEEALRHHPQGGGVQLQPLAEAIDDAKGATVEELSSWYSALVSPSRSLVYECKYHPPLNAMEEMADVAGFYRAFGLEFEGDRADHLCMELEFMRLLALKEARALLDGEGDNAEICVSAQREFMGSHLGRWVGSLSLITESTRFYGPLCRFLAGWMGAECSYHLTEPEEIFYSFSDRAGIEHISPACVKEAD
ncbi:MAG: molecular chaperone TorD family protein [Nitrospirota bacterium]|jgi:TorA maturation chaperone TorD